MNNLKNKVLGIYQDNKKIINIVLLFIIVILILTITTKLINNNSSNSNNNNSNLVASKITLFGDNVITINQGEEYIEPGFYAISQTGEIKTDSVTVINTVNTSKPGTYTINYILNDKKVTRTIIVLEKEEGDLTFTLNGNSIVVLNQGDTYIEPGFKAYDSLDGDIEESVTIVGLVDTTLPGTYTLTYTVTNSTGIKKTLTRKVVVNESQLDANISLSNSDFTSQDISINIDVTGSSFSYIKFPNGTVSKNKNSSYVISENGTYQFYIYNQSFNYLIKEITITNIDKKAPTGTCTAKIENGKTYFSVIANDTGSGIKNYKFYGDNKLLSENFSNSYMVSSVFSSAYVLIYDKALNATKVNCTIKPQYDLEVHFINVGREDAILIRSSEKTILIDGGSYSKKSIVTPYLKDLGVTHIDAMIGSHLHYNHIQAQADILENFQVDKIYYPQDLNTCYSTYCDSADQKYILSAIKKYNKEISIMKVNDSINIGDMNIFCVGPIAFQTKSQNKYAQNYNSLNFILTYGSTKFMFTGDYMQSSNILKQFDASILDIDVLKYPHHGESTIGKSIITAMTPKYTVITNSRDGLSGRSEKTYLTNVGSSLYYSYKHGNILITSDGKNLTVKTNVVASDYKR